MIVVVQGGVTVQRGSILVVRSILVHTTSFSEYVINLEETASCCCSFVDKFKQAILLGPAIKQGTKTRCSLVKLHVSRTSCIGSMLVERYCSLGIVLLLFVEERRTTYFNMVIGFVYSFFYIFFYILFEASCPIMMPNEL
jgi:hypothetical protein